MAKISTNAQWSIVCRHGRIIAVGLAVLISNPAFSESSPSESTPATSEPTPQQESDSSYVGVRIDCNHNFNRNKGSNQNCLTVSGLRIGLTHKVNSQATAKLQLDPFAVPAAYFAETPVRDYVPSTKDSALGIVDDYSVIWAPRPNLALGVESYEGATAIPSTSGIALLDSLTDEGWKQTALTLTYNLAAVNGLVVQFAGGNGEGESGANLDPQQYFGFRVNAPVIKGLSFVGGLSFDGNSVGSERFDYEQKLAACGVGAGTPKPGVGYSAQRFSAGLVLDGTAAFAPGLKAGLGWQKSTLVDLQKGKKAYPLALDLSACEQLNPGELFVEAEDPEKSNSVVRATTALNISWQFAETWFVGADVRQRKINMGSEKVFQPCSSFSETSCATDGDPSQVLKQTAWTLGFGKNLADGLVADFGYNQTKYDKKYSKFYYLGKNGKASDTIEVFNARIAYNWR